MRINAKRLVVLALVCMPLSSLHNLGRLTVVAATLLAVSADKATALDNDNWDAKVEKAFDDAAKASMDDRSRRASRHLKTCNNSVALLEKAMEAEPQKSQFVLVYGTVVSYAVSVDHCGDNQAKLAKLQSALVRLQELLKKLPDNNRAYIAESAILTRQARLLTSMDKKSEAVEKLASAVANYEVVLASKQLSDRQVSDVLSKLAQASIERGDLLLEQGQTIPASLSYFSAYSAAKPILQKDSHNREAKRLMTRAHFKLARIKPQRLELPGQ